MSSCPTDTLSPTTFYRSKYRDLSDEQMEGLTRGLARLLRKYGIDPEAAPNPGEDEAPEAAPAISKRRRAAGPAVKAKGASR